MTPIKNPSHFRLRGRGVGGKAHLPAWCGRTLEERTCEISRKCVKSELHTDKGIIRESNAQVNLDSLNQYPICAPQSYRAVLPATPKNIAVKYISINPTFRGRDKQRIGQQEGTGIDHQGKDAKRFADYWIDGSRWNVSGIGVVQQPSKCHLWEIDNVAV